MVSARSARAESWLARSIVPRPVATPSVVPPLKLKSRPPDAPAARPAPRLPEPLKPVPETVETPPVSTSVSAPVAALLMASVPFAVPPVWTAPRFRLGAKSGTAGA